MSDQTSYSKTINARPVIHANTSTPKCLTNENIATNECSLGSFAVHPPNTVRVNKQTASGDTGDTTLSCEQPKYSLADFQSNMQANTTTVVSTNGSLNSGRSGSGTSSCTGSPGKYTPSILNPTNGMVENKTNLIINYLPPNMTQEEVRALFSSIGEVESCKLVREKTSGESLGYAFVKFYNPTDAGRAIKTLNGLRLQNKTVKVSLARPSSEAIKGANLYICGLPRKMTQLELEKLFSTCGHIITARILYDTKNGLSRGVAFIRYDQRAEAEVAIRRLNGYVPSGANEPITVKFANSPSSNRQENATVSHTKSGDHETSINRYHGSNLTLCNTSPVNPLGDMGVCPVSDSMTSSTNHSTNGRFSHDVVCSGQSRQFPQSNGSLQSLNDDSTPPPGFPNPGHKIGSTTPNHTQPHCNPPCLYDNMVDGNNGILIGRGPMTYPAQGVANSYSLPLPSSGNLSGLNMTHPETGMLGSVHKMSGPARFKCHTAAMATAAAFSGTSGLRFRAPNTMLANSVAPNFPTGLPNFGMDFMRGLGPSTHALLAPAFAASSGALTATGWCIFVYNLAPETEESILWQLFGPFGAVQTVKVIRDSITSKCKGFGFVTMSNYEEALLAIHSLNGFNLGNRVLQVSFKTTPNTGQMKYTPDILSGDYPMTSNLTGSLTPVPSVPLHPQAYQQTHQEVATPVQS